MHLLLLAAVVISLPPADSAGPNRQPQLASSNALTTLVFGNQGSVWFSKSLDGARTFSQPIRVGGDKALALGRHRGPRVVISGKTIVVSAVLSDKVATGPHAHGLPENGDLLAWRSTDAGVTWTGPVVIDDVPGAAREGLHAMTTSPDGTIAAAWLDLRGPGTRLYGAYSKDAGATWSRNQLLYESPGGTICQCCHPSLASDGNAKFIVVFRNVVGDSRDMYLAHWDVLTKNITKPEKSGTGSWTLNACPMDGGGLAIHNGAVTTAWRRGETVFLDHPGSPEKAVGEGKDIALAVNSKGAYLSWTGKDGIELLVPQQRQPELIGKGGSFSTLLPMPKGVLAAWECDGNIEVTAIN